MAVHKPETELTSISGVTVCSMVCFVSNLSVRCVKNGDVERGHKWAHGQVYVVSGRHLIGHSLTALLSITSDLVAPNRCDTYQSVGFCSTTNLLKYLVRPYISHTIDSSNI